MSWSDLDIPHLSARESPIESEALGLSVGRVVVPGSSPLDHRLVADAVSELNTELTILRAPAKAAQLGPHLVLELPGHVVMHVDTLVYWALGVTETGFETTEEFSVDTAPATDAVGGLVRSIFAGYQNHYSSNPALEATPVDVAYSDWATRHSVAGEPTVALRREGTLVAIATYSISPDHLEILLAGVSPEEQGKGVYPVLLGEIAARAARAGRDRVLISTQAHNAAVQRAWARFGFLPLAAFNTFHAMKRPSIDHLSPR